MSTNTFTNPGQVQEAQTTRHIMMVRPKNFGYNPETAKDNDFQTPVAQADLQSVSDAGVREFDAFVDKLVAAGVQVHVVEDSDDPAKQDAVYPNNWITTHADGVIVTYPMLSENRRLERRPEIIEYLDATFNVSRQIRLEGWEEQENKILEGTGSMILDRENRIVYCALSQRADQQALEEWAATMRYEICAFHSRGLSGKPIYHTNVLMALGTTHAVICLEVIPDKEEQKAVVAKLKSTGKEIVEITNAQVDEFAGNMIELKGESGPVWVMSSSAYNALTENQRDMLSNGGKHQLLHADLKTIEEHGGGSARCMIAELFLPTRS